jgi:hypothetical protein
MLALSGAFLAYLAITLILLAAATLLIKKPSTAPSRDDRVQNHATRGTYIPLGIDQLRYGSVHLWSPAEEPVGVGSPAVYSESGLHAIGVGPASTLHAIYQNGELRWRGPITPATHPSGSSITVADLGTFEVYWGYDDDPVLPELASAVNFGAATKMPLVFKIFWRPKILGFAKQWPRMEYDVDFPCHFALADSPTKILPQFNDGDGAQVSSLRWKDIMEATAPYLPTPTSVVVGQGENDRIRVSVVAIAPYNDINGLTAERFLFVCQANSDGIHLSQGGPQPIFSNWMKPGDTIKLYGNAPQSLSVTIVSHGPVSGPIPNVDMSVLFPQGYDATGEFVTIEEVFSVTGVNLGLRWTGSAWEWMTFTGPTPPDVGRFWNGFSLARVGRKPTHKVANRVPENPAAVASATLLRETDNGGTNPIAMLGQLLFAPFPYGAGRSKERFDMQSFEEAAAHFATVEAYRGSIQLTDGETFDNAIGRLMQDVGILLPQDPTTGLTVIKLVRNPVIENLPELGSLFVTSKPTTINTRGLQKVDKVMFTFRDRLINYRDQPISFDDDGNTVLARAQSSQTLEISTTTGFSTAVSVAKRRTQEVLSNHTGFEADANHAARLMFPGLAFLCPTLSGGNVALRLTAIKRATDTSKVELQALVENYDPPPPTTLVGGEDAEGDEIVSGMDGDTPQAQVGAADVSP